MKKTTIETVINYTKLNSDVTVLSKEIGKNDTVEFICSCGNHFTFNWYSFKKSKYKKCKECIKKIMSSNKRKPYETIKADIETLSECKLISKDYVNALQKLKLLCSCGKEFDVSYDSFMRKNQRQCPNCGHKNGGFKNTKTKETFLIEANNILGEDYTILNNNYKRNTSRITVKHHSCGSVYTQTAQKILQGNKCPVCFKNPKRTKESVQEEINNLGVKGITVINYFNSDKIELACECGNTFFRTMSRLRRHKGAFCDKCKVSSGVRRIESFLIKNNIEYIREYKFDDCVYIRPLPFDFYLPKLNICIEFDGDQHNRPIKKFGGEETFTLIKKRDSIKDNYCLDNNIKLIRIKYSQTDKIEKILSHEFLNM